MRKDIGARRALSDAMRDMRRDGVAPKILSVSSGIKLRQIYKVSGAKPQGRVLQ